MPTKRTLTYIFISLLALAFFLPANAAKREEGEVRPLDTIPTWQGGNIKVDIGNTIYEMAVSGADRLSFEAVLNFNLKRRFFPTIEGGFASAKHKVGNGATYSGKGAFGRIGLDINCFKPEHKSVWLNLILIGARVGFGTQKYDTNDLSLHDVYWGDSRIDFNGQVRTDVWVEVNASLQVNIYKGFTMGWGIRERILCTRGKKANVLPWYIPGYGVNKNASFGFNYYIGYRF